MSDVLHKQLQALGVGIFVRKRASETRLRVEDMWRAYNERVIVWVRRDDFGDDDVFRLIELLRELPDIATLRFSGTALTNVGVRRVKDFWPDASIEGVSRLTTGCS
jgi:hypothetical protein